MARAIRDHFAQLLDVPAGNGVWARVAGVLQWLTLDADPALTANSDARVATEKATKAYVDTEATARAAADAAHAAASPAHAASAISVADTGGFYASANVEGALAELGSAVSGSITAIASVPNVGEIFIDKGWFTIAGTSEVEIALLTDVPFGMRVTSVAFVSQSDMPASDTVYWVAALRNRRSRAEVTPYSDLVLADAPTAYWRLDEAVSAANALDSGSGNQPLAYSTTPPTLGQPSLVRACSDTSATFVRASGTFAGSAVDYGWDFSSNQVTIEAVIKPTTLATGSTDRYTIFGRPDVGFQPSMEIGGGTGGSKGRLAIVVPNAFECETANSFTILASDPYHVLYRRSAFVGGVATQDIFINGIKQVLTTPSAHAFTSSVTGTYIGKRKTSGAPVNQFFDGGIDDVAVYNTALSDARVQAHADAARSFSEIGRKLMKTPGAGGEGVTAWKPWGFSGVDFDSHAQILEPGDGLSISFFPFGGPAQLTNCSFRISYEAL